MAVKELSDGGSAGTRLGQSSTDLVSFFGAAVTTRPTTPSAVATTAASTTTPWGFTTSTQANAVIATLNSLKTNLDALGLQG